MGERKEEGKGEGEGRKEREDVSKRSSLVGSAELLQLECLSLRTAP